MHFQHIRCERSALLSHFNRWNEMNVSHADTAHDEMYF